MATYFCASDVVFIQRRDDLNSGNIPMAFLFKKVVVGPDTGNIGEILKSTGNPVFDSQNSLSVRNALQAALNLSKTDLGRKNYDYAMTHWRSAQIGAMHASFYRTLVIP